MNNNNMDELEEPFNRSDILEVERKLYDHETSISGLKEVHEVLKNQPVDEQLAGYLHTHFCNLGCHCNWKQTYCGTYRSGIWFPTFENNEQQKYLKAARALLEEFSYEQIRTMVAVIHKLVVR